MEGDGVLNIFDDVGLGGHHTGLGVVVVEEQGMAGLYAFAFGAYLHQHTYEQVFVGTSSVAHLGVVVALPGHIALEEAVGREIFDEAFVLFITVACAVVQILYHLLVG